MRSAFIGVCVEIQTRCEGWGYVAKSQALCRGWLVKDRLHFFSLLTLRVGICAHFARGIFFTAGLRQFCWSRDWRLPLRQAQDARRGFEFVRHSPRLCSAITRGWHFSNSLVIFFCGWWLVGLRIGDRRVFWPLGTSRETASVSADVHARDNGELEPAASWRASGLKPAEKKPLRWAILTG